MLSVPPHVASLLSLVEGWHEVRELDVERDLVRRLVRRSDDGPTLDDVDEEERMPFRVARWQQWMAS